MLFVAKSNRLNSPLPLPPLPPPPPNTNMSFSPALLEHSEQVLQASVTKYLGQKSSDVANGGPALLEYRPSPLPEHHLYAQDRRWKNALHCHVTVGGFGLPSSCRFALQISFFSVSLPPNAVNMQQQHFSPHQKDEAHGATS